MAPDLMTGVINLGSTKGSLRQGAQETVAIDLPWLVALTQALLCRLGDNDFVAPRSTSFRRHFDRIVKKADLQPYGFKPYSLRRGGATELWKRTANLQRVTLRGRWSSDKTTRIYIQDGAAQVTTMKLERRMIAMSLARRFCERMDVPMSLF